MGLISSARLPAPNPTSPPSLELNAAELNAVELNAAEPNVPVGCRLGRNPTSHISTISLTIRLRRAGWNVMKPPTGSSASWCFAVLVARERADAGPG
jgi:hypothetical protein